MTREDVRGRRGAALDHALHYMGHEVCDVLANGLMDLGSRLENLLALLVLDPGDEVWLRDLAAVGDPAVCGRELQKGQLERPEGERGVRRKGLFHAEAVGDVDDGLSGHQLLDLRGRGVERVLDGVSEGHEPLVAPVVVQGHVRGLALFVREQRRAIEDRVGGGEAMLPGGQVDERLERRAALAFGLHRPVELRPVEVEPAREREDRASAVVKHHHRALDLRLGHELDFDRLRLVSGYFDEPHQQHVAGPSQAQQVRAPSPPRALDWQHRDSAGNHHRCGGGLHAGGEGVDQLVLAPADERPALVAVLLEIGNGGQYVAPRPRPAEPLLQLDEALAERVLNQRLEAFVQCRLDLEAALEHPLGAEAVLDGAAHLLDEIRRRDLAVVVRGCIQRYLAGRLIRGPRDVLLFQHAPEHVVAALQRAFRVVDGRELAGPLRQPGQQRGLGEREVLGRLAEVEPRGGLDAVVSVPEIHLVGVEGEDLVL